jgi:8-oxo-dGTP pyrophosphatase MutT (NUDIX family)
MTPTRFAAVEEQLLRLAQLPTRRPVAGGIVVNRSGEVALVYSTYAGQGWHFPKGGLDEGETSLEGAIKETNEEAGMEVRSLKLAAIDLGLGGTFSQFLNFGSPRGQECIIHNPRCEYFGEWIDVQQGPRPSDRISQVALDLLRRAAYDTGMTEEEFSLHRYELFDRCCRLPVCWQQHPVYHVLGFSRQAPHLLNGESEKVRWWSLNELERALQEGRENIHRNVARLLPQLREVAETARGIAEADR